MTTLFVLSGPSGAGKSILIDRLLRDLPRLRFSVSCTTRPPRAGEVEGVNYHFLSRQQFLDELAIGRFFEYAEYSKNLYGTSHAELEEAERQGQDLLLDIEVQGARQLQEKHIEAVYIFVTPPNYASLESRLRSRNTEDETAIRRRLAQAVADMPHMERYQYIVINDNLEEAYTDLRSIFIAERLRTHRMKGRAEKIIASFEMEKQKHNG